MTTVKALMDGAQEGLELLGELRAIKGVPAQEMRVKKRVVIPGAGSYWKSYPAPLYDRQVMVELAKGGESPRSFSKAGCLGALASAGKSVRGYVHRRVGLHHLCVPVYDPSRISPLTWKTVGYLPVGEEGYVAVMRRRVAYWVWLAIAALLVFAFSYLFFVHGPEAVWATLTDLPQALSDAWFRLLRDWGVV